MQKKWKILFFMSLLILLLGSILIAPEILRSIGIRKLEENCKRCSLTVGDLDVNVFTGSFTVKNLNFRYEEKNWLKINWIADRISGDLSIVNVLKGDVFLGKIKVHSTEVQLFDSDGPRALEESKTNNPYFNFVLKGLDVEHGKFTYTNQTQGHISQLNIPYVSATLGEFGNTPELRTKSVEAIGRGRVAETGDLTLKISTYIFDWPPVRADVDIVSTSHDLSDLTPFFNAFAGVSLKGHMLEGSGKVSVRGNHASASIRAKYQNFDVTIKKMYDRSATAAFFMTLGKKIIFDDKNTDKNKALQIQSIETTREKNESVPGFILRSLREAAIAIVSA